MPEKSGVGAYREMKNDPDLTRSGIEVALRPWVEGPETSPSRDSRGGD